MMKDNDRPEIPFRLSEVPSLSPIIAMAIAEAEISIVPGKVTDMHGQIFANFSLPSDELAVMTASDLFLDFLKPATEEVARKVIEYADGCDLCVAAAPLPPAGNPVIGFRCVGSTVPVNIYVARRDAPDRHQFIIEARVTRVEKEDGA
jgi:hypothetical protein